MIYQHELAEAKGLRSKIESADKKLKVAKARLADLESLILDKAIKKEEVEHGEFSVILRKLVKRASISWKEIVEQIKGKEFIEKTLLNAERKEIFEVEILKVK